MLDFNWMASQVAPGSIGDWGHLDNHAWYPDITPANSYPRRCGANFNFGAMGAAASWDLGVLLDYADRKGHAPDMDEMIMAGFNWYRAMSHPALPYGGTLSVPIVYDANRSW